MQALVFEDDFRHDRENAYPDRWLCESDCELPFRQGVVQAGRFHISPGSPTSRQIPLTPPLADFRMELEVAGNPYFSRTGLELHFRYDRATRRGGLLRYAWGVCGGQTHHAQTPVPEYRCEVLACDGSNPTSRHRLLAETAVAGFVPDLSRPQRLSLSLRGRHLRFEHDAVTLFDGELPEEADLPGRGLLGLSRSDAGGDLELRHIAVHGEGAREGVLLRPETATVFPAEIHGIQSPYRFHLAARREPGRVVLAMRLTGGPSQVPIHPDIDRQRFNEMMFNPYVRVEDRTGREIGRYLIFRGSVGLDPFHWNTACSVWEPADACCPLSREVYLEELPEGAVFYIGYEHYRAEDSIGSQGGPAEACIDAAGKVLWAGPALPGGALHLDLRSPEDKAVCRRIPRAIHDHEGALAFARRNHFFVHGETVRFQVRVASRDATLDARALRARLQLESVFGEPIGKPISGRFPASKPLPGIPGAVEHATRELAFPELAVGVYHVRVRLQGAGGLPELRRAFEVMPRNPADPPAPRVSGLPELLPNILSGIRNEHFHPWGAQVVDTAHYNSGGNNYFKVARQWNAPDLLHAYGRSFTCWLKPGRTVFDERGIEPNRDLVAKSDAVHITLSRFLHGDLWGAPRYSDPRRFALLVDFLRSGRTRPVSGGRLDPGELERRGPADGLTGAEYAELLEHHWKAWILFFCERNAAEHAQRHRQIKAIHPACRPFVLGPSFPAYACGYKMGYFALNCGYDLRGPIPGLLTGPNGFEDYPLSSGYPIARSICHLAAAKLEAPRMRLLPEVFGINGETRDGRVVLAHPPYGRSDPPPGFLEKQFYEYNYGAAWLEADGIHFWNDQGYYPKTWDRENYAEMLRAHAFIARTPPAGLPRTTAFCYSREACLAHPEFNEADDDFHHPGIVPANPAEEATAFAYEQARVAGQQNGFLMRLEDCAQLDPAAVDLLAIPPLCGVSEATRAALRGLHRRGVALLGFWDASGLEDLFGVEPAPPVQASCIAPVGRAREALGDEVERTGHPLCVIRHRADPAAEVLLADQSGAPVLVRRRTSSGQTAFFTLPPMFVRRSRTPMVYGQRSNSLLMNRATAWIQELLGDKVVTTSAGTLLAFVDRADRLQVIVSEDRCPRPGRPIRPLVRIRLPGIAARNLSSDKAFEIVALRKREVLLRLALEASESARITLKQYAPGFAAQTVREGS